MKSNNEEQQDDGYTLDFTALEDNTGDKLQEIAMDNSEEGYVEPGEETYLGMENTEDELDYMPMEAGSGLVELPGLTDGKQEEQLQETVPDAEAETDLLDAPTVKETQPPASEGSADQTSESPAQDTSSSQQAAADEATRAEASAESAQQAGSEQAGAAVEQAQAEAEQMAEPERDLHFAKSDGLLRPVNGEVLIPFSMDSSVYFSTLDQYKYNSAMMIQASEDTPVVACAEGRVVEIYQNEEIGNAVTMEIGDGYQVTYGQLKDVRVSLNEYVNRGETFAMVAAPTKYFCLEGSNLYLRLTMEGAPVNPEVLFR